MIEQVVELEDAERTSTMAAVSTQPLTQPLQSRHQTPLSQASSPPKTRWSLRAVMAFLVAINMLNFIDRGVISGAPVQFGGFVARTLNKPPSQQSVYLGLLTSAFVSCYAIASIILGELVRHCSKFRLLAGGLMVWICALVMSGIAFWLGSAPLSFYFFLGARSLSGVGEAAFQCIVPPYVEDFAPAQYKSLYLAIFFTAIPTGTAIGFEYGALMAGSVGWGYAFLLEALLMLPLAVGAFFLPPAATLAEQARQLDAPLLAATDTAIPSEERGEDGVAVAGEPISLGATERGADAADTPTPKGAEDAAVTQCGPSSCTQGVFAQAATLVLSPTYMLICLGYASQTASVIGLSTFGPLILLSLGDFVSQEAASLNFGLVVALGGVFGTPFGGWLSDRLIKKIRRGRSVGWASSAANAHDEASLIMLLNSALMVVGTCFVGLGVFVARDKELRSVFFACIFFNVFFVFSTTAGVNRSIMLTVPTETRAFALAMLALVIHACGDVPAPVIIGALKDALAPNCNIVWLNHTTPTCEQPERGCINPVCTESEADQHGLHVTLYIGSLWMGWAILLWALCWCLLSAKAKQLEESFRGQGSAGS